MEFHKVIPVRNLIIDITVKTESQVHNGFLSLLSEKVQEEK